MEIKEKQNREILQAYMKYELGITGQADQYNQSKIYVHQKFFENAGAETDTGCSCNGGRFK